MDMQLLVLIALLGVIVSLHIGLNATRLEKLDSRLKVLEEKQS